MKIQVSPSILSANFANLSHDILRLENAGADMIHIDVMDGHFVHNITIGPSVIAAIRQVTKLPFDVHLMIDNPLIFVKDFALSGADIITIHYELSTDIGILLDKIKSFGCRAGLSIMPSTPIESVYPFLNKCDLILIMTVEPGFGGQDFMMNQLPKISKLSKKISEHDLNIMISVDGGINDSTASLAINAGANVIVSGSYIFRSLDMKKAISECRGEG